MPIFPTGVYSVTNPTPSTSRASGTTGPAEQVAALNGEVSAIENYLCGGHGNSVGAGIGALTSDTSGTATAGGYHALAANTAAALYGNTAFGYQAGAANTTGGITAFGYNALMSNVTAGGTGNTDEQSNSAFGMNALKLNTSGIQNTAVGGAALYNNSTGQNNVAVGSMALECNTIASNNTGVGWGVLLYNATGAGNTALGAQVMCTAGFSGSANTGVGFQALGMCSTGSYNVGVGFGAGQALTTGGNNTLVGLSAGYYGYGVGSTVTGSDNVFIGVGASPGNSSDPSHCTAIGGQATCIGDGSVAIGRDSGGNGAAATIANQIMLGTANHTVYRAATNTARGATASTPTIANTATGVQVDATKDVMLYLTCSLAGTGFTLKIGPTSTPAYTLVNNVAVAIGECFSVRVPGGWYVSWQATTATFANQQAVTC
jgi:hypothetical protein